MPTLNSPLDKSEYRTLLVVGIRGVLFAAILGFLAVPGHRWEAALVVALLAVPGCLLAGVICIWRNRRTADGGEMIRHDARLTNCPLCGGTMEYCFANGVSPLSYEDAAAMRRSFHISQDLANRGRGRLGKFIDGLRTVLPWKVEYFLSYRCQSCSLYIVDYGTALNLSAAKKTAANISPPMQ